MRQMTALRFALLSVCFANAGLAGTIQFGTLLGSLDSGSLAGNTLQVSFSYDSSLVAPTGDSFVPLASFDFTFLGATFSRNDISQGGQVIFHNNALANVTASFQSLMPPNSRPG